MRNVLSRLSVLLFLLFLAGIVDIILYLAFDAHSDVLRTLPGQQHEVVGKLPEAVSNIYAMPRTDDSTKETQRIALLNDKVLAFHTETAGLTLHFQELRGRVWRGELHVGPQTPPGRHTVTVSTKETLHPLATGEEASTVLVDTFADAAALRQSYVSLSERFLGIGPWWLVTAILPLAGLLLLHGYRRAGEEEARLRARGLGPIYKLARGKDHWDILFGLGSIHGVQEGETLALLNAKLHRVGTILATRVGRESTEARLGLDADISPFHVVTRDLPTTGAEAKDVERP